MIDGYEVIIGSGIRVFGVLPGHGLCDSVCKSATLALATNSTDVISSECCALMRSIPFDPSDLRGVRS